MSMSERTVPAAIPSWSDLAEMVGRDWISDHVVDQFDGMYLIDVYTTPGYSSHVTIVDIGVDFSIEPPLRNLRKGESSGAKITAVHLLPSSPGELWETFPGKLPFDTRFGMSVREVRNAIGQAGRYRRSRRGLLFRVVREDVRVPLGALMMVFDCTTDRRLRCVTIQLPVESTL